MGWKRENFLKLEKIWQLWKKITKKLEWILLKEKKMKEKNTKHHEKKICIITEIEFFQISSCLLIFHNQKLGTKPNFHSLFYPLNLRLNRNFHVLLNKPFFLEISSVKVFLKSDLFYLS